MDRVVAKINKKGVLELLRAEKWKAQGCPWTTPDRFCGDWCPLFEIPDVAGTTSRPHVYICCGGRMVTYDPVIDDRKEGKK